MSNNTDTVLKVYPDIKQRLSKLDNKIDLLLEQQKASQRAVAFLKADLKEIVQEAVKTAINRHRVVGVGNAK